MKIHFCWKDPGYDGLLDFIRKDGEVVRRPEEDRQALVDMARELGCGEYLMVELDTETRTLRVLTEEETEALEAMWDAGNDYIG